MRDYCVIPLSVACCGLSATGRDQRPSPDAARDGAGSVGFTS
jgi:hypothetical protein